jgi:pilus assembly protein CpaE
MNHARLSIAAHGGFPGSLLDGAMPSGDDGLLIASGMSDFDRALMTAERDNSEALLLFTPRLEDTYELLRSSRASRPAMALIVAVPGPQNGQLAEALRAGADEIVILPAEAAAVATAIHKAMARVSAAATVRPADAPRSPLVAVLGPKGGTGKTTLATNLAADLATRGQETLLVDLDLQFGDVGVVLGVEPDRTIYDLATAGGTMDAERLRGYTGRSRDGVNVLLAPVRPDQADAVTGEHVATILDLARTTYDVVIVDTPPAFTPATIAAVDQADLIVMLGSFDLPGLKNMKLGMETLQLMDIPPSRILPVLNRANTKVGLLVADVAKVLGRAPEVAVPSDRGVPQSVNAARPIICAQPKSGPARSFRVVGDRVAAALLAPKEA